MHLWVFYKRILQWITCCRLLEKTKVRNCSVCSSPFKPVQQKSPPCWVRWSQQPGVPRSLSFSFKTPLISLHLSTMRTTSLCLENRVQYTITGKYWEIIHNSVKCQTIQWAKGTSSTFKVARTVHPSLETSTDTVTMLLYELHFLNTNLFLQLQHDSPLNKMSRVTEHCGNNTCSPNGRPRPQWLDYSVSFRLHWQQVAVLL